MRVNIYIRKEDEAKWKELGKERADWLHLALRDYNHKPMYPESNVYIDGIYKGKAKYPKPVKQIIEETNQSVVEALGNSEVLRSIVKENERLDYLKEHPDEKLEFDGLGAIVDDSTSVSTYESLNPAEVGKVGRMFNEAVAKKLAGTGYGFCKHNSAVGFCKFSCKKAVA